MLFDELFDTLQNLIKIRPSRQNIADILGVSQAAIGNRIARESHLKYEELLKIEQTYGIVGALTGQIIPSNPNTVEIDFYPNVFGSCGAGLMVFDESCEKVSVTKDIIKGYSEHNKYSIISARGSSMSPRIEDDDKLIIQHNLNEQIIDDTVYLFRYNDELFIKRLVKNVDQIVCISENPRFQDRIIEPKNNNFSIVGKVVGLIRYKV